MKIFTITLTFIAFTFNGFSQIIANPGTNNWSSPTAWAGGVVPTINDPVFIGLNATIVVDFPLTHNADIDINGGTLTSFIPSNSLTMNNANLSIVTFASQFAFALNAPVPVTVNDGVITNGGVYYSGDLILNNGGVMPISTNDGDFSVTGDMTLLGMAEFTNNLGAFVSNALVINSGCEYVNNQSTSSGWINNDGIVDNLANMNVTDSLYNLAGANYWSDGGNTAIGSNVNNMGNISLNDNMSISGLLMNSGSFNNDGGAVTMSDYLNSGTTSGSLNGAFGINMTSENTVTGAINGMIDVCDSTLMPGTYLDIDAAPSNIDFVSVTFCGLSMAGVETNVLESALVLPNPTNGYVTLLGVERANIDIYAADGKKVKSLEYDYTNALIDLCSLPSGIYQMNIVSEIGSAMKRIVKQ